MLLFLCVCVLSTVMCMNSVFFIVFVFCCCFLFWEGVGGRGGLAQRKKKTSMQVCFMVRVSLVAKNPLNVGVVSETM